ncbi:venom carboxylesterase-6-like [Anoplophora glabripennis]|uniref:venom carboxylesterase-6-like n=1 Tax=Anoplophora glabripennis TaxID=217634 RepID=UPI000C75C1D5|nr:venom carboxylesterase-6-like [Anoplophora glabripennis]
MPKSRELRHRRRHEKFSRERKRVRTEARSVDAADSRDQRLSQQTPGSPQAGTLHVIHEHSSTPPVARVNLGSDGTRLGICSSNDALPEIDTPLGRVRGLWKESLDGRKFAAFEGVPYAKPPVGDLRFEEPHAATPWTGTWLADNPQTCTQIWIFTGDVIGEEDCLYLNVYVPADYVNNPKKLEVVVSIHGGAFLLGQAHSALPEFFMDKDFVLVTINYRLGIFGFLSTEDGVIPGNNGMRDQVQAFKWIKDNIASFGGNPNSVTIQGMSAGGTSVHFHYFSPLSKGLFHRGFSQSGTVLAPWTITKNPLENAKKLAVLVGCPDGPSKDLKKCLKQRPAQSLVKQMHHFFGYRTMPISPFAPVVEKGSKEPFLDKEPFWLLQQGKVLDVPWVTSHTADDGLMVSPFYWDELDHIDQNWDQLSPYFLDYNNTLPESRRVGVSREILVHYFGPGGKINKETFSKFTQMLTDRYFAIPGEMAAKMQANVSKSSVYYYIFSYKEGVNKAVEFFTNSTEIKGVGHGDDCIYLQGLFYKKPFSEQDKRLKNAFQNMLYEFASTGIPSFDGTNKWQPTGPEELTFLNVTGPEKMKLQKTKSLIRSDFWSKLGLLENQNAINVNL